MGTQQCPPSEKKDQSSAEEGRIPSTEKGITDTCMVPGCGYKTFVDAHHIVKRSKGGKHYINNGVLLCPNHHREADHEMFTDEELKSLGSDPAG